MTTDTKAVARWDIDCMRAQMDTFDDGRYVEFTYHERVVGDVWEITREIQIQSDKYWNELRQLRATLEDLNEAQAVGDGTVSGSLLHWHQRALAAEAALAASRAEIDGFRSVLQQIEVMAPVHGLNPLAKISDPQHVKVCWNTQLAARSALAAMEKGNV